MAQKLRNVTVTLEEPVAHWARMEAARQQTSVSRFLGTLLKERMLLDHSYEMAMNRALNRESFAKSDGRYLTREEAHDRDGLR